MSKNSGLLLFVFIFIFLSMPSLSHARALNCGSLGDINQDGAITVRGDYSALTSIISSSGVSTLSFEQKLRADVNGDGLINAGDANMIWYYAYFTSYSKFSGCDIRRLLSSQCAQIGNLDYSSGAVNHITLHDYDRLLQNINRGYDAVGYPYNTISDLSADGILNSDDSELMARYLLDDVDTFPMCARLNAPCGRGNAGDMNNDGFVDIVDIGRLQQLIRGDGLVWSIETKANGDVNADGHIDEDDLSLLLTYIRQNGDINLPACRNNYAYYTIVSDNIDVGTKHIGDIIEIKGYYVKADSEKLSFVLVGEDNLATSDDYSVSDEGSFTLNIPLSSVTSTEFTTGNYNFYILIVGGKNRNGLIRTDHYISVADPIEPTVTFTSGNLARSYTVGDIITVTGEYDAGDFAGRSFIVIEKIGRSYGVTAEVDIPNTGTFSVDIPFNSGSGAEFVTGDYAIRAYREDSSASIGRKTATSVTVTAPVVTTPTGPDAPCGDVGDLDGDGIISSVDALMASHMNAGNIESTIYADVNADGSVTLSDSQLILSFGAGHSVEFRMCRQVDPCGSENRGDIDGDGKITVDDYVLLYSQIILSNLASSGSQLTDVQETRADFNADGHIDETDASLVLKYMRVSGDVNNRDDYPACFDDTTTPSTTVEPSITYTLNNLDGEHSIGDIIHLEGTFNLGNADSASIRIGQRYSNPNTISWSIVSHELITGDFSLDIPLETDNSAGFTSGNRYYLAALFNRDDSTRFVGNAYTFRTVTIVSGDEDEAVVEDIIPIEEIDDAVVVGPGDGLGGEESTLTFHLNSGWNLVASPITEGISLDEIEAAGCVINLYDSAKIIYYDLDDFGWRGVTTIASGVASGINVESACDIPLTGTLETFETIQLYAGENFFTAEGTLEDIKGTCEFTSSLEILDSDTNYYYTTTDDLVLSGGYVIDVEDDCELGVESSTVTTSIRSIGSGN